MSFLQNAGAKTRLVRFCLLPAFLTAIASMAMPAQASLLFFQWEGSAIHGEVLSESSWYQESAPTPITNTSMTETDIVVSKGETRVTGSISGNNVDFTDLFTTVSFFNDQATEMYRANDDFGMGGFSAGDGIYASSPGPQIYSGTEAAPLFSPGMYQLSDGRLLISAVSSVPETSTWGMLLIGFSFLGLLAHRRLKADLGSYRVGSPERLVVRRTRSRPLVDDLEIWLIAQPLIRTRS